MLKFLDDTYDKALEEISLLSTVNGGGKKVRSFAIETNSNSNASMDDKFQKAKSAAGKCPVCKDFHSFKKNLGKDAGKLWPSDRFVSCKKFRDMNVHQRALAIQTAQGCPRCTSWRHTRTDCKAKSNSCGETVGGIRCQSDHSKLVHGSNNVYCAAIRTKQLGSTSKPIAADIQYHSSK